MFPNATRVNRGNSVMKELADTARANNVTDLIILHEHRGVPDSMVISHFPHGPTLLFTLHNVTLRHDTAAFQQGATVSEQYPHLLFENFSSKLGHRVKSILKYIFPVPRADSKRVMTFNNDKDFISFRHHVFVKTGHQEVQIAEVGPRFEMRRQCNSLNRLDSQPNLHVAQRTKFGRGPSIRAMPISNGFSGHTCAQRESATAYRRLN